MLTHLLDFIKAKKKKKTNFSFNPIYLNYEKPIK